MKLVITEKPSVAKAIYPIFGANMKNNGYMEGNGYIVSWCFGHLVGLYYPDDYCEKWAEKPWNFSQLPMLPDVWKFKISKSCREQFYILKKLINDNRVDKIICATDADREGECIFRYVYNLSGCRKPVKRLWVSSLEESAISSALNNMKPMSAYDNLYSAGFCRAKADWLVGMNGSRLFSCRYKDMLSLGRVQTPTLAMIVKRDYEIKNFVKQKYFTVELDCGEFSISSERIDNESIADSLVSLCDGSNAVITPVEKEIKTVNTPKLYDLTTLQRDANKAYGYTAQQTLDCVQFLYEAKLVTYPRTDSQYLSDDMEQTALKVINAIDDVFDFGTVPYPDIKRCINNSKVTGHHAIIPTLNIVTADLEKIPTTEKNVLKLIANRLLCASAGPHKYEAVKVTAVCNDTEFSASGKTTLDQGWKQYELKNSEDNEDAKILLSVIEGQQFTVSASKSEHFTSPPKPYTENTLLSAMEHAGQENYDEDSEKKGLGTPATRAGTIEGLIKHGYAERKGKKITATEKGVNLINVVPEEVKSPQLTAEWEMQLQQIERGEYSSDEFMNSIVLFIKDICSKYEFTEESSSFTKRSTKVIGSCPKCGSDVKKGKYGFYCTGKCGMQLAKVFRKELTEIQLITLLNGSKTTFISKGKKTTVLPEITPFKYKTKEGKEVSGFQWRTK